MEKESRNGSCIENVHSLPMIIPLSVLPRSTFTELLYSYSKECQTSNQEASFIWIARRKARKVFFFYNFKFRSELIFSHRGDTITVIKATNTLAMDVNGMFFPMELFLVVKQAHKANSSSFKFVGLSDPYTRIYLDSVQEGKTKTIDKTLNPVWNEDFCLYGRWKVPPKVIGKVLPFSSSVPIGTDKFDVASFPMVQRQWFLRCGIRTWQARVRKTGIGKTLQTNEL